MLGFVIFTHKSTLIFEDNNTPYEFLRSLISNCISLCYIPTEYKTVFVVTGQNVTCK